MLLVMPGCGPNLSLCAQICCGILANLVVHAEGSAAVADASGGGLMDLLATLLLAMDDAQVRCCVAASMLYGMVCVR